MSKKALLLFIAAALLLSVNVAQADLVPFFNTGVDGSGTPLSGGSSDPHYNLDGVPAIVMSESHYWTGGGPWIKPTDARWIYNADIGDSGIRGWHDYTTTFNLTGYKPSTAQLTGLLAMDQYGTVSLNGVTEFTWGDQNWADHLTAFAINSNFQSGTNTLTFRINLPDGYDGLVLSNAQLTADPVPVPPAVLLLGSGLAGLGLPRLRRKA